MTASFTPGHRIETITCGDVHYSARFSGHHITLYRRAGRRRDLLQRREELWRASPPLVPTLRPLQPWLFHQTQTEIDNSPNPAI